MTAAFKIAQQGLEKIKTATRTVLAESVDGMTNAEIADALGLRTSFSGKHKNYLTYSILHLLVEEGEVASTTRGRNRYYFLKKP